jgi:C4-dicarboxylate transporter
MMKKRFKQILIVILLLVVISLSYIIISEYKFKNNIIIGMELVEIQKLYGKADKVTENEKDIIYIYYSTFNKTVFVFSKKEGKLKTKWKENWYFIYGNEVNN